MIQLSTVSCGALHLVTRAEDEKKQRIIGLNPRRLHRGCKLGLKCRLLIVQLPGLHPSPHESPNPSL